MAAVNISSSSLFGLFRSEPKHFHLGLNARLTIGPVVATSVNGCLFVAVMCVTVQGCRNLIRRHWAGQAAISRHPIFRGQCVHFAAVARGAMKMLESGCAEEGCFPFRPTVPFAALTYYGNFAIHL
jgi:hypothetical protein